MFQRLVCAPFNLLARSLFNVRITFGSEENAFTIEKVKDRMHDISELFQIAISHQCFAFTT